MKLASDLDELGKVEKFVKKIGSLSGCSDDLEHHIMLVLTEAVTNAILHGNKQNREKSVDISAEVSPDRIALSVRDQGPGFDPESIPSPLSEENLLKSSGRGIWLMREYADNVSFSEKGRKVTIEFKM